jgi:hypothetical protein
MDATEKFRELAEDNEYAILEICVFKYGKEPFLSLITPPEEGSEEFEYELIYYDIQHCLQKIGKLEELVENFEKFEIEKDEADPFHWRNKQKHIENLKGGLK